MEDAGRHLNAQFTLASDLIEVFARRAAGDAAAAGRARELRLELESVRARYTLCTSYTFILAAMGGEKRQEAREEFNRVVSSEGFEADLESVVRRVRVGLGIPESEVAELGAKGKGRGGAKKKAKKGAPPRLDLEVKKILEQFSGHGVDCAARTVTRSCETLGQKYNFCADCGEQMSVSSETSELTCMKCGKVRELIGTVFDDSQFYNQEGQKAKSGSFNPNRHFHYWMNHILAREPEDELAIKEDSEDGCKKLLEDLRNITRRDNKILRLLTVDDIRSMLRELDLTRLNKNIPKIMRMLTGVGPPPLPEEICQRVEKLFSRAIEIGERIRPPSRMNRNYYPYYIYKILDAILPADDLKHRRVLYYIYMQGQDTLDKNDREWAEICEELPEITWVRTDPAKAEKYRPG